MKVHNIPFQNTGYFSKLICDYLDEKTELSDFYNNCPDIKNLAEEPGIPELERLYYDKYDYDTGEFDKMTDTMKILYKSDVDELYKIFTGNDSVPETVTQFSDIKLKDYYDLLINSI